LRLTSFGAKSLAFYVALVGAFFASPYSNLFFLLLGFLTLVGVAGLAWTRSNMHGVHAFIEDATPMAARSAGVLGARASIRGRRQAFQVHVSVQLERGEWLTTQVDSLTASDHPALDVPPLPRGIYPVRRSSVSSTYPFGVLRVQRRIDGPTELVVYPEPTELVSARTGAGALAELLSDQVAGEGDLQPSGLRDHRDGDELRSVHWRATARRGKLVVCEWEGGAGQGLEVLIDRRCEPEELEQAFSFVSALIVLARANKEVLAIYSQDLIATFGEGHRSWNEALRFLAAADILPASASAPPSVSPSVKRLPHSNPMFRGGSHAH
jgi:uncharacterized protein (DUF58 family)